MSSSKTNILPDETFEFESSGNLSGSEIFPDTSGLMTDIERQVLSTQLFNIFQPVQSLTNVAPAGLGELAGFAAGDSSELPLSGDVTNLAMGIIRTLLGIFTGDFPMVFMELANFTMEKMESQAIINSLYSRGIAPSYFLPV